MQRYFQAAILLGAMAVLTTGCGGPADDQLAAEDIDDLVTAMIPNLSDPDPRARVVAIRFLAGQGDKATEALPKLKELTKDKDPAVREAATHALKKLESTAAQP